MPTGPHTTPGNLRSLARPRRVPFPHMGPQDTKVWQMALVLGLVEFERYEYDVRLGGLAAALVDEAHTHRPMWDTLLRKRVDVVAWSGDQATLIEVKPVASFAALGQCLGYGFLWGKEKPRLGQPRLMCVCAVVDSDLVAVFEAYRVAVVTLPAAQASEVLAAGPAGLEGIAT